MGILESTRSSLYWFADFLTGSKVRKEYNDVRFLLSNENPHEANQRRNAYLEQILRHSTQTTEFYSKFKDYKSLDDFPVINKSIIKENFNAFQSSRYRNEHLHKVTTSGSTGAPLTILQNIGKRKRHEAENIYFSEQVGYPLGSRLYYNRVWNEINKKSLVKRIKQNIVMQEASNLSDANIESFLLKLEKDSSTKTILAFSSTFEAISRYLEKIHGKLPVKVSCLITISETLPEGARDILKAKFNCPVVSRYSNMENGFLAQQCIQDNNEYHINTASYFIEMLDPEADELVADGRLGRVVVTDLFNYAMPLIRYDTGDMAIISKDSFCGAPGPVFKRVEGRKVDFIYDTLGNLVSPHVVTNTMWKYSSDVKQFQFLQNGPKDYNIKLNTIKSNFNSSKKIIIDLKEYLGDDAEIGIEFVDEIPLLASGKRKKIVNNYIKIK